jgi:hypothetical protein
MGERQNRALRRAFRFLDVLDLALGCAGSFGVGADSGLGQSGLRPLSHAVNRQPTAHALSRITRRSRIVAAAALRYSPRMAKKIYLHLRCVQLARVLKKTGSFYYHCDWHASHYVKVMLD